MDCITKVIATSFIIFLTFISRGFSEELENPNHIEILCCSWHHDREADYNEVNPGIFYLRDLNDRDFFVGGGFKNSLNNNSILLGVGRTWELTETWDFRMIGGIVTGYSDDYPIVPAAMPSLIYRDRLSIHVIPGIMYSVGFTILEW